jgi:hypothetical protein
MFINNCRCHAFFMIYIGVYILENIKATIDPQESWKNTGMRKTENMNEKRREKNRNMKSFKMIFKGEF